MRPILAIAFLLVCAALTNAQCNNGQRVASRARAVVSVPLRAASAVVQRVRMRVIQRPLVRRVSRPLARLRHR